MRTNTPQIHASFYTGSDVMVPVDVLHVKREHSLYHYQIWQEGGKWHVQDNFRSPGNNWPVFSTFKEAWFLVCQDAMAKFN